MTKQELFLKTIFCCMSCDGDIATEEIDIMKKFVFKTPLFEGLDIESTLDAYISDINGNGMFFLKKYLSELAEANLSEEEQLKVVDLAIKTIEVDNRIEYSEVKYFKKIRSRLSISDEQILGIYPDKEDYLLPDINITEDPEWNDVKFESISLK